MEIEVPESVQAFNFWTLLIMARLWDEFPRPIWLNSTPIAVHVTSDRRTKGDPIGPEGSEQVELFTHTELADEGRIRRRGAARRSPGRLVAKAM